MSTRGYGRLLVVLVAFTVVSLIVSGCGGASAPAQPAKPAEQAKPAEPAKPAAEKPKAAEPAKPAEQAKPAESKPAAEAKPAASKEPYKLGAVFSLTGAFAGVGGAQKRAIETAVEAINEKGGVDGHPIQTVFYDDQSRSEELALLLRKLAQQDRVPITLGSGGAAVVVPVKPVIQELKVPTIASAALTINKDEKYLYSLIVPVEMGIDVYLAYAKKKGWNRVAAVHPTDDLGERSHKYVKQVVPQLGMEFVAEERFGLKDTDVTPQLSKVKAANPQVIMAWATGDPAVLLYKNSRQLGLDVPLFPSAAATSLSFFKLIGEVPKPGLLYSMGAKIQGLESLPDSDPVKALGIDFVKRFQAKYNARPELTEAYIWDMVMMAANALKAAGPDREKIRDYLETAKWSGLASNIQMSADNHNGVDRSSLLVVMALKDQWQVAD